MIPPSLMTPSSWASDRRCCQSGFTNWICCWRYRKCPPRGRPRRWGWQGTALFRRGIEKVLIVNIVSLVLINNKVNEQKEFLCLEGMRIFLFDGAKLRIIRGIFAKIGILRVRFNRS